MKLEKGLLVEESVSKSQRSCSIGTRRLGVSWIGGLGTLGENKTTLGFRDGSLS
jgi:hypothetical protein